MKFTQLMLAVLFLAAAAPARAGDLDLLLDRLVEKNVIDPGEAQEIRIGTQEEVKKEISQQRHATMPMWLQTMKLRGDVRLRYQFNDNHNKVLTQHRGRYRLRFFIDAKINEKVYTGFGFASGSSADPRSTNQTFGDNYGKKSLWIDYVFAEYNASDNVAFTAGRTKNPLWLTSDMLWDTDVNMEGLSARVSLPVNYNWDITANAGFMALAESASDPKDPYMLFAQPAVSWQDDDGVFGLKAGAAVYTFNNLDNSSELSHRPSTTDGYQKSNTLVRNEYKYNYDALSPELELNANILDPVSLPLVTSLFGYNVTYAGLFGNYIKSLDHGKDSEGWIAGFKVGQRKVEDAGQWQLRYSLRRLEADAWLDNYPDSDFFGGSTNVKGHEVLLTLGLLRSFAVDLDYYQSEPIRGSLKKEKLFQADINLKF